MKIFWVGNAYPEALEKFFSETEDMGQSHLSYQNLKEKIDASYVNYFATGWCRALQNIGYETENVVMNALPLQQLWLKEHGIHGENLSPEEYCCYKLKNIVQQSFLQTIVAVRNFYVVLEVRSRP